MLALLLVAGCSRPVDQPIAYNHKVHVADEEMKCQECHVRVEDAAQATLPALGACEDCHLEAQGESPEEAKVVQAVNDASPIGWKRVYWVRDHVFFSHRRHVKVAEIPCADCHGEVRERTHPFTTATPPVSMARCIACHRAKRASTDCAACHR